MQAQFVVQSEQVEASKKDASITYRRLTLIEMGAGACRQLFEHLQKFKDGEKPKDKLEGQQVKLQITGIRQRSFGGKTIEGALMELIGEIIPSNTPKGHA